MTQITQITPPRVQLTDNNNFITREWYRFFLNLFNANASISSNSLISGTPPSNPSILTLTGSPFVYTNANVYVIDVIISGGGVTNLEFSRNGTVWYNLGDFRGMFQLSPSDKFRVSYTVSPIITLIPR